VKCHRGGARAARCYRRRVILIGQYDSPFVRRVAVALQHHALPYEHRTWSVWRDADQVATVNPLRRVPVLVMDDGEQLVESGAILDAIDDLARDAHGDEHALIPRAGAERRAVLRVCAFATGLADKGVSLLYEHVLREGEHRSPVWVTRCQAQIGATLDLLERERAARPGPTWFGRLTHADVAVACMLRFVGEAHPALLGSRPALAEHAARCEAMPIFQAVVQPLHVAV